MKQELLWRKTNGFNKFFAALLLLTSFGAFAQNSNITITTSATSGGSFSGTAPNRVFTPTANNANIQASSLVTELLTNNVTINTSCGTCTQAGDVTVSTAVTAATTTTAPTQRTFTINAGGSITVNNTVNLTPANVVSAVGNYAPNVTFTAGASGNVKIAADLTTTGGAANNGNRNGGNAGAISLTGPAGVTNTGNLTANGGAKTGSGTVGADGTFTINDGGASVTSGGVNDGQTAGAIDGGALTKSGSGIFFIGGNNTYTTTAVTVGTLRLGSTSGLGSGSVSVTSGAALDLNGINYATSLALTLNGTGISSGGALINSNATGATYAGLITLGSTSSIIATLGSINISNTGTITGSGFGLTLGGAGGGTLSSILGTGAGTLTKTDAGTWTLAGLNTYTGITNINGGIIKFGQHGSAVSGPLGTNAGTTVVANGAALDLAGWSENSTEALTLNGTGPGGLGALRNTGGADTYAGLITLGSASSIMGGGGTIAITNAGTITGATFGLTLGGAQGGSITSIIGTTTGSLTKQDGGTWTLLGANSYTGGTTISGGTLTLGASGVLADAGQVILDGGTFNTGASGFAETMGTLKITNNNSTITFGSTTVAHALHFAASNGVAWGSGILTVNSWQGSYNGTAGTKGQLFVGSASSALLSGQVGQIQFFDGTNNIPSIIRSNGEVVPSTVPPSSLSYNTPNTFTAGTAITALNPTVTGVVASYSVSPALPSGLSLNTSTGVISGTPVVAGTGTYTVTATNAGGSTNFNISITVNPGSFTQLQVLLPGETATPGTAPGKTGSPTAQNSATAISVIVNAVDANWNVVSSITDNISITSSDAAATLPSTAALVSGTRTFSITLFTAPSQTVTAHDVPNGSIADVTSASVTINPVTRTTAQTGPWNLGTTWVGGIVPATTDPVIIRSTHTVTVTADATCASVSMGDATTTAGISVNTGVTLTVTGALTVPHAAGAARQATIAGAGSLDCASLNVGTSVTPATSSVTTTLTSTITDLSITGNLAINSYRPTSLTNNGVFTITSGVVTVGGTIQPTTASNAASIATLTMGNSSPKLIVSGVTTPFGTTGNSGVFTTTLNGTGATVEYGLGGAQTVLATTYTNLTLSNSGTKTVTGVTVNGVLSMEGTATASAAPTYGAAATLQYNTGTARTASSEWITPFAATGGVVIANTGTITMNAAKTFNANVPLTINPGATLSTSASNFSLTLSGNFVNGGTLNAGSSAITVTGTATQSIDGFTTTGAFAMTKTGGVATLGDNITVASVTLNGTGGTLTDGSNTITVTGTGASTWTKTAGTFTATGTVNFTGSAPQIGATNFNNLQISVGSTATLTGNVSVTGTTNALTFTSGTITTGANTITLASGVTTSGAGTGKYVFGNVAYSVSTGASTKNFPVGDGTYYTPLSVSFTNATVAGTLTVSSSSGDHASITSSGINAGKSVNHVWTITNTGITFNSAGNTATATFNWVGVGTDADAGSTPANYKVAKLDGASWTMPTTANPTATSLQATGLTVFSPSSFQIGEQYVTAAGDYYRSNVATGNWNVATNWQSSPDNSNWYTSSRVPDNSAAAITIQSGHNITVTAAATASDLTIAGTLTMSGSNTLDVTGDWTKNGTFTANTSTITFNGSSTQTITGSAATTFYNLTINENTASTVVNSTTKAFTVTNTLTVTKGNLTLQATDANYTVNDVSVAANGTISHNVDWATGKLLSVGGDLLIDGIFTYSPRSHVQMTTGGSNVKTGSNASSALGILTLTNSSGTISAVGNLKINDNFYPSYGVTGGTFSTNGQAVTANAGLFNNGGTVTVAGGSLTVTSGIIIANTLSGTLNLSSGTITTDGLTLGDGNNSHVATFNQSGGNIDINGNLTITNTSGTYTCTNSPTITITGNWTNNGGTFTPATSTVTFDGSGAQNINGTSTTQTFYNLASTSGSVTVGGSTTTLTVNNDLSLTSSTLVAGTATNINVAGDWTNNGGSFTPGTGRVTFNGGSAQTIIGPTATTFYNVTLNNSAGLSFSNADVTISNILTLTSGKVNTGTNTLIMSLLSNASISGPTTAKYIIGNLKKGIPNAASATQTFEIGDATNYTPINLTFTGTTTGSGSLTAFTSAANDPNIATSTINESKNVLRYWSLTNSGVGGFTGYSITLNFVSGDITGGANTANFIMGRYNSGWNYPTVGVKTSVSTQATNSTTAFGTFIVGEGGAGVPTMNTQPSNASACSPASAAFTAVANSVPSSSVQWQINTGSGFNNLTISSPYSVNTTQGASITTSTLTISPSSTSLTGYQYRAIFTNTKGNVTSNAATLTVSTPSTVTPGGPDNTCQSSSPSPITLTGSGFGGGATTAAWSITSGGGSLSSTSQTASPATVTYTPAANYTGTVTLTLLTNAQGACTAASNTRTINVNPLPTVTPGGPDNVCQSTGTTVVTLSGASVGGGATTGAWSLISGSGSLSSTAQTSNPAAVTFTISTNFTGDIVLQLLTNAPVCGPATSGTRTIHVNLAPTVSAGGNLPTCQSASPGAVTLSGTTLGGSATTGAWSISSGGGSLSSTAQTSNPSAVTYTPAANFTGTAVLTLTTNNPGGGCTAVSSNRNVFVNPLPLDKAVTVFASPICDGTTDNVIIAVSETGISYQLRDNSNNASIGSPVTGAGGQITFPTGALYDTIFYNVLGTSSAGCSLQMSTIPHIYVYNPSGNPTSATSGASTICNGSSTTLTLVGGGYGTNEVVKWYTGSCAGTAAATGQGVSVSPTTTTTYYGRYEDPAPCSLNTTCASVTVTVNAKSTAPTSATATPATICNGQSSTLSISGGSIGTGGTLKWYSGSCGGTLVGTGNNLSVSPSSTTTYYARYEDPAPCNTLTACASVTLTVNPLPSLSATPAPTTVCLNNTSVITVTNSGGTVGPVTGSNSTPISGNGTDPQSVSRTITLPSTVMNAASNISVTMNVSHTFAGDVTAVLSGPCGSTTLFSRPGGTSNGNDLSGSYTFTSTSGTTFPANTTPITNGTYNATFSGLTFPCANTGGTWTLTLSTASGANNRVITINSWSITITNSASSGYTTVLSGPATIGSVSYSGTLNSTATANVTPPVGTNVYTITTTDGVGCSNSTTASVTVNPLPAASVSVAETSGGTNNDGVICTGATVTLTANPTSGMTYSWAAPISATGNGKVVNPASSTTYTVTVTNSTTNCSITANTNISVPLPTASISVAETSGTTNNDGSICTGASATLTANPTSGATYSWAAPISATGNIKTVTPSSTTGYVVTVTENTTGCQLSASQTITVNSLPSPTITPNYCVGNGNVSLTSNAFSSYAWSTGETTQSISVDEAGTYFVTVTNSFGCTASAFNTVAIELVTNGNFNSGNTGFTTGYNYISPAANAASSGGNSGLGPEGTYAVDVNAHTYHSLFWGLDHTSGTGKMMVINGATNAVQPIAWQETVTIQPNTTYYFSAWAMSVNNVGNYAQLQFNVNGVSVGTIANLGAGPNSAAQATANNYWQRFYGTWNSGSNTSAVISIVDLQTIAGGNDFALDDISCSTLSTVTLSSSASSTASSVCAGNSINLLANRTGGMSDFTYSWSGPNSFTSSVENPVINNATTAMTGTYKVTITDAHGCSASSSASVTVNTPTSVTPGTSPDVCQSAAPVAAALTGASFGGGATTAAWSITSGGGTLSSTAQTANPAAVTYKPANNFSGTVTLTLTTNAPAGCTVSSATRTVTVNPLPAPTFITAPTPTCINTAGYVYSTQSGQSNYLWSISGGTINSGGTTSSNSASVTWTASGTKTISINYTDSHGCTAVSATTANITVQAQPTITTAPVGGTICLGSPMNLSATTTPAGLTYQWQKNGVNISGATSSSYSIANVTNADAADYTIIASNTACNSASATATINVTSAYNWPYTEDFESISSANQLPNCITTTNLGTKTFTRTYGGIGAHSGTDFGSWGNSADDYFFTAGINLTAGVLYEFTYWYWSDNNSSQTSMGAAVGTTPTVAAMSPIGTTLTGAGLGTIQVYHQFKASFTPSTTGVYYFGVHTTTNPGASADKVVIDDIGINIGCTGTPTAGTAAISNNLVCAGTTVNLSLTGYTTGPAGITFQWQSSPAGANTWSDISGATATTYSPVVNSSTDFRCKVTCTYSSQNSLSNVVSVTVNPASVNPTSATATPSAICFGQSSSLKLNGGGGGTGEVIKWYTASCGGTLVGTGNNLVVSPTSSTTYYGRYEDPAPCSINTTCASVTVTVNSLPVPSITFSETSGTTNNDGTICNADNVILIANPTSGMTYSWAAPISATGNNKSVSPSSTTAYSVTVTNSTTSCSATAGNTVTVNTLPPATISVTETSGTANNDGTICNGDIVGLTANPTSGMTYAWASPISANGNNKSVTPGSSTTYKVTVTNSSTACSATATSLITVNTLPNVYTVTGGACIPAIVGLSNSQNGVNYQLILNGNTNMGSPIAGTGAALDFGAQIDSGIYTIVATNPTTNCSVQMTGVATVSFCTSTWIGVTDTNWHVVTNWDPAAIPNNCYVNVLIPLGTKFAPEIHEGDINVRNINISSGVTLTLNGRNLNVCGHWTGGNGSNAAVVGSGTTFMNSPTIAQNISGNTKFDVLQIVNNRNVILTNGAMVSIARGLHLQTGNLDVSAGSLRLLSTAANNNSYIDNFTTGFTGSITGMVNAERYIPVQGYNQHFISSPVNSAAVLQLGASGPDGKYVTPTADCDATQLAYGSEYGSVFVYNDGHAASGKCMLGNWMIKSQGNIQTGLGYSSYQTGGNTRTLTGFANTGNITVTNLNNSGYPTVNTSQGQPIESGWNLVGNPYPSSLDLTVDRTIDGFENQVQIWQTSGPYQGTWQPAVINGTHGRVVVPPFQAFMVHIPQASTGLHSYKFYQSERTRATNLPFYRTQSDNSLSLEVNYNGAKDVTHVEFNTESTVGFDAAYDANKYDGNPGRPTLYTTNNTNTWYAINTLPTLKDVTTVPMGLRAEATGTMTLTPGGLESFDPTTYIFLEDKKTNTWHNLRDGAYTFTTAKTDNRERFVLHFTPPASILTTDASCDGAGMINIEQPGDASWSYSVTDNSNTTVATGSLNNSSPVSIAVNTGVYMLTLRDNNGYTVTKSVIVGGSQTAVATFTSNTQTAQVKDNFNFTSTSDAVSYSWDFGDGVTATGKTASHSYSTEGIYQVTLTVMNAQGCSSGITRPITVTSRSVATNIGQLPTDPALNIWSHENSVYVDFSKQSKVDAEIELYNVLGQMISSEKFGKATVYSKQLSNISAAYLIVKVKNDDKLTTKKVFLNDTE